VMHSLSPSVGFNCQKDITDAVMYLTTAPTVTGQICTSMAAMHFGRW